MGLLISLETSAGCGLAKAENAIGQNAVCALELEMPGWGRLTRQQKVQRSVANVLAGPWRVNSICLVQWRKNARGYCADLRHEETLHGEL